MSLFSAQNICHAVLPGPDVVNDWPLDPRDHEVSALSHHLLLHSNKPGSDLLSILLEGKLPQFVKTHLSKMTAL